MRTLLLLVLMLCGQNVAANTLFFEDFEHYGGVGLQPGGGNGTLDSNQWRVTGLSLGETHFGDHQHSASAARGRSPGKVRSGGLYAFDIATGHVLGWQSTGADLTPGSLLLQIHNGSSGPWRDLWLDFELWFHNDQPRSSAVSMHAGTPGEPGLALADFKTPLAASALPTWQFQAFHLPLANLIVAAGHMLSIEWRLGDSHGSGSRDELAIDNLHLTGRDQAIHAHDAINTLLYCSIGLGPILLRARRPKMAVAHLTKP